MVDAYRQGIPILFPVHDELNASLSHPEQALKLKEIMETSVKLDVPSYTEVTTGPNWAECK
jgi:DNA polymerase I-like protein with 3'-5' exonuclease and polymerase domains